MTKKTGTKKLNRAMDKIIEELVALDMFLEGDDISNGYRLIVESRREGLARALSIVSDEVE